MVAAQSVTVPLYASITQLFLPQTPPLLSSWTGLAIVFYLLSGLCIGLLAGIVTVPLLIRYGYGVLPPRRQPARVGSVRQSLAEQSGWTTLLKHVGYSGGIAGLLTTFMAVVYFLLGISPRTLLVVVPPLGAVAIAACFVHLGGTVREMAGLITALVVMAVVPHLLLLVL